ncbi:hypothetical protein PaG_01631 [Moesziomyces aphidis]|uniref:Zn(2)-C6 fungal-type domain-containing protein n=1 Tax=Moesziomyces aphidis TaxID=84754 RepID=W3VPE7_MOEAP|nr:hypothetical protein PaG_01631 [Moesziomyces aphidis]
MSVPTRSGSHAATAESSKDVENANACPKCGKTFSRAVNRDRHLATHNAVPSLACSICQRRFHRADVLAKHVLRHRSRSSSSDDALSASAHAQQRSPTPPKGRPSDSHTLSTIASAPTNEPRNLSPSVRSLAASRKVSKACSLCNRAKVRCDGALPVCGRCSRLDKAILCKYTLPANAMQPAAEQAGQSDSTPAHVAGPSAHVSALIHQDATGSMQHAVDFDSIAAAVDHLVDAPPSTNGRQLGTSSFDPGLSTSSFPHHFRPLDSLDLESWRQSQAQTTDAAAWSSALSPLPVDWLLQNEIPDDNWAAYLGDPGVPLIGSYFEQPEPSFPRWRYDAHHAASSSTPHATIAIDAALPVDPANDHSHSHPSAHSRTPLRTRTPQNSSHVAQAHRQPSAISPASMDANAAAATLARIRSEAVNRGLLRSASPSEDDSSSSSSCGPEEVDDNTRGEARAATHPHRQNGPSHGASKRRRSRDGAADGHAGPRRSYPPRSPGSSSESSDLDPMERANRDIAAQPRQQRVSYRHPDPSARNHLNASPAAPSPEDVAMQELVAEELAQRNHQNEQVSGRSPHTATSDRSSKRRKRRHKYWPSVYRPKATDGGRHLSLQKVPFASDEVIALENSYQVAPMTDQAKERMIDEFRFCEVEPQDLRRIQDTLRSTETATLNVFVQLYFEHHDAILPILHRASFDPDTCDPLLLAAVTCLGALCSKAENAFAYSLLTSSLVHAVSYKLIGINHLRGRYLPSMQTLLLTYALWRNLGDPAKLEYVEGFRNIVLTMARRCRLFELVPFVLDPKAMGSSQEQANDAEILARKREQEWQRWIRNQEMVRMSWALLALDSDLSLAWDLPCTVTIAELGSPLPCVESLWQAESAEEWMGMSMEQAASAHKSRLSDLLCTSRLGVGGTRQTGDRLATQASAAKESSMDLRHSSPMTRLVLSAAVHNLVLSRWNLDTVLSQYANPQDDDDGEDDDADSGKAVLPHRDPALQSWVESITAKLNHLTSSRLDTSSKGEAQLMLHGARLRMLVSFKMVQIMSGRKGHRRAKVQMKRWLKGPLQDESFRTDLFSEASKIFTLSISSRRDIAPLNLASSSSSSHAAVNVSTRGRSASRSSGNGAFERAGPSSFDSSGTGHATFSGTGAENSILFYATVCLALLCQWLQQNQRSEPSRDQSGNADVSAEASSPAGLTRGSSVSRKTRRKDVYFLSGVGALTHAMSLDRLIHVAVHQGLNRSAWPLGYVLGKVLQQWARTLAR